MRVQRHKARYAVYAVAFEFFGLWVTLQLYANSSISEKYPAVLNHATFFISDCES